MDKKQYRALLNILNICHQRGEDIVSQYGRSSPAQIDNLLRLRSAAFLNFQALEAKILWQEKKNKTDQTQMILENKDNELLRVQLQKIAKQNQHLRILLEERKMQLAAGLRSASRSSQFLKAYKAGNPDPKFIKIS
ncbi:MAG: hypothetical protein KBD78_06745 [Oligoflexales bacterium]|nr:hypothetical protein [Oligoflexales bacterium]